MAAVQPKHFSFYSIGLSYRKADAEMRGLFSLNEEAIDALLQEAKEEGIPSLAVISTCNRTELYGFAEHPYQLIRLLCEHSQGTVEEFQKIAYIQKNDDACQHLYTVGTGLDSQILGDFEIIGQLKMAFKRSKKLNLINTYMERLLNCVIQASKRIKTETELSSGATSVSFASAQYILENYPASGPSKNILLFGTGKIGRNTCENLVKHTVNKQITLINRTKQKAEVIAGKFDLVVKDFAELEEEIANSDIIIVATGAQKPTISKQVIHTSKPLLILDLSIPKNVDDNVKELDNVTLIHLDELSKITHKTLSNRENFIPQAREIIATIHADFKLWIESRQFAPTMHALKTKLSTLKDAEIKNSRTKFDDFNHEQADVLADRIIQKIAGHFANHLRNEDESTEEAINLLNKVFKLEELSN
ncbi:MAG: glutamyl-tRNA reductase [Nonlabens sp.]|uniref:glutamyl-tRNA reductase n=1 Tax=Nonlabens sp. TaxID=1888209 RepID=UPI003EF3F1D4